MRLPGLGCEATLGSPKSVALALQKQGRDREMQLTRRCRWTEIYDFLQVLILSSRQSPFPNGIYSKHVTNEDSGSEKLLWDGSEAFVELQERCI